jgi:opacity protein-like surface antigen
MRKILSAVALALAVASPALAKDDSTFYGRIVHVSSNNVKVQSKSGQTLSFLILPKFKNVWSDDGKTTYQMSFLHNGTAVEILYDQSALGARHADKIIVLRHLPR